MKTLRTISTSSRRSRSRIRSCRRSMHTEIADPRPLKAWLIKRLMPAVGHGLLSGQWGTGKTFVVFDLAAALWTGQPFLGHSVKRQCGVLLIAAEGAGEVRLRLDAVVRNKCGNMERAPFRWYETTPTAAAERRGRDADRDGSAGRRIRCSRNSGCRSGSSSSTRSRPVPATRGRATRMIRQRPRP